MAKKATQKKTRRSSKKRLALPGPILKNFEEVRKNIKQVQGKSAKEVEKIYNKVVEIDFVKKVRKHDMVKKAVKTSDRVQKNLNKNVKKISQSLEGQLSSIREMIPVPSRTEVEALAKKVNALDKKITQLNKEQQRVAS